MSYPDRNIAPRIHSLPLHELPEAQRTTLENGVEVVNIHNDSNPVSRITMFWPAGNADVENCNALQLLKLTLTEGTKLRSGAEIAEILEYSGAWIKVDTGRHNTMVTLYLLNRTAETVIPLLGEIISRPGFREDTIEQHRENAIAKCRLNWQKVKNRAIHLSNKQIYGSEAPAVQIITPEGLRQINRADIVELHQRLMLATTPTLFLAGDTEGKVMQLATEMACQFTPNPLDAINRKIIPAPELHESVEDIDVVADSMQTAVRIAIPTIGALNPDFAKLNVSVYALGGYFGSLLMSNIREDKGYTYGITAALLPSLEANCAIIQCETDNKFVDDVLRETQAEIHRLCTIPLNSEEVEIINHTAHSGLLSVLDSPFSILDNYIVEKAFGQNARESFRLRQQAIIEATPQSILEAAAKYLLDKPQAIALAGNPMKALEE